MANGQLIADRSPSVSGPKPFYRLNIIDNLDGTCSVYVEDRANSDGVSDPAAVTAVGLQIKGSAGSTPPGGLNTQLQYNNAGAFGGISGATTDGASLVVASGNLWLGTSVMDSTGANTVFVNNSTLLNTFVGYQAGNTSATGTNSVALGQGALTSLSSGSENTAIGQASLNALNTGGGTNNGNTAVGAFAGFRCTTTQRLVAVGRSAGRGAVGASGTQNVAIGVLTLANFSSGGDNVALGTSALTAVTTANQNVAVGTSAGAAVQTGSANVFLGYSAGASETGSNKLYIANTNTTTPLIGGDFSAGTLQFNGAGGITNYRGVTLAGAGIPSISGFTSQKAETAAADANVLTVTPPAAAGTYRVSVAISVSSATNGVISWTLTYKDSNGNAQSNIQQQIFQMGTAAPNVTFTTSAAGNYYGSVLIDVDNSQTAIVVAWVGGGTTAAKISASIERLK